MDDATKEQIRSELCGLRKGQGVSLRKLDDSRLAELLGPGHHLSAAEVLQLIRYEAQAMGDTNDAQAVRNALNFDNLGGNLTYRRGDLARVLERDHDTIKKYETRGFSELAKRLALVAAEQRPLPSAPTSLDSTPDYVLKAVERTSRYIGRTLNEIIVVRHILAEIDGLDVITTRFRLAADPAAVQVLPIAGCTIERSEIKANGVLETDLRLSRVLVKGGCHTLTTRIVIDSTLSSEPWSMFTCRPEIQCERAIFRIQFDPTVKPEAVWWMESITEKSLPGKPTSANGLTLDSHGYIEKEFSKVAPGLSCAVVWRWPE